MCNFYVLKNSKALTRSMLVVALVFTITLVDVQSAFAQQKAVVKGMVKDANSGEPLPGVGIKLSGTYTGTSTDARGEYSLFVSPGEVTLEFSFIGSETKTESFTIAAKETKQLNVDLVSSVIQLSEVFIEGSLEGQQKALNQQRASDNIKNIVAADQIGRFPDQNSAEALSRVPGINVQRDEGDGRFVLVRGLAPQFTNISINGEQIPSPEAGARFVALDAIPANQLASMEVSKAITPEMDGDAIGGSVNLITQTATSEELQVSGALSLEYNNGIEKTAPQANLSLSKRSKDGKFGMILAGSYLVSQKGSDRYEIDGYNGDNPDGIGELVVGDYEITRKRVGLSTTLDYNFSENSKIYLRALYSAVGDQENRRQLQFESEEDEGEMEYTVVRELKDRYENQGVYSFNLGGSRVGPKLKLDYEVAYSKAFQDTPHNRYTIFENEEDVAWNFNIADRKNPRITNFTYDGTAANYNESSFYSLNSYEISKTLAEDQNTTAKINLGVPLNFGNKQGELKFGGKVRFKEKSFNVKDFNIFDYEGDDAVMLSDLQGGYTDNSFMGGDFGAIGYFANPNSVDYLNANLDLFESEEALDEKTLEAFTAQENVYAGYVQGKVQFNKLMILGGLRYEKTTVDYNAAIYEEGEDEFGEEYATTIPYGGETDYGFLLPMLHFKYSVNKFTNIRAAITKSYSRPNFQDLVQGGEFNRTDEEASIANPDLKPVESINLDLFGEHYLGTVGIISAGIFYKSLDKFIYQQTFNRPFADLALVEVTQAVNGGKASLLGFELAWQQNLTFLPGLFGGLGVYANYTYTHSNAEVENFAQGDDLTEIKLPGQAEHIGNLALTYTKGGFNVRATVNFNGSYISEIDGGDLVLIDSRSQLDVSISQTFKKITAFGEFVNLNNAQQVELYNNADFPKQREQYGFWTRFGIKFKF
jgi:TonB-dependent receptor